MLSSSPRDESRFTNVCTISSGGCGTVQLCGVNGTTVLRAIKTARTQMSEQEIEKFQREVHTLYLNQHPTIIRVFNYGVPSEGCSFQPWMELEFVPGGSVTDMLGSLRDDQEVDPTSCHIVLTGLAHALAYLHARYVIHRDVKPANVMLNERGEPRLADFGFARELFPGDDILSYPRTMNYAAPEVLKAQKYSNKVDVYGFGMTLYEIRKKEVPYTGRPLREVGSLIMDGHRPNLGFRDPYNDLYMRCTALRPSERPEMSEVLAALQEMATSGRVNIDKERYENYVNGITNWQPEMEFKDSGDIECLIEAAETCPKAMYHLGWCYYKGVIVEEDESRAGDWFTRAAIDYDCQPAVEMCKEMIDRGELILQPVYMHILDEKIEKLDRYYDPLCTGSDNS